ncbi:hypothetical protein QYE76_055581 [Lolium multiflorum]|uniref:RNase H type-1 domain-containing protein n=1 Tax=Lolium multiflorum TaxID=4521 RepID=A0AAD8SZZ8_LOLMU|nr:hypothetical protein QYE76_055581 [Lolium multiflorum]
MPLAGGSPEAGGGTRLRGWEGVADVLAYYCYEFLERGEREGRGQIWRVCRRAPGISHLLFADDTLLFFKADGAREKWLEELLLSLSKGLCDKVLMILWRTWFVRNEITHNKLMPPVEGSRRFICSYMASLSNISKSTSEEVLKGKKPIGYLTSVPDESPVEVTVNLWVRPPEGEMKLNVDGSFMASDGKAGAGMILRAHDGTIIFSACRSLEQCNSALEAELCAIMEGTALAVERCQQPIMIETDSAEVVRMLTTTARDRSSLGHIVAEARTLINSERVAGIVKIPRSQNVASHLLAGYSRLNGHTAVWLGIGPEPILDALLRDCNTSLNA